ncbi:ABC-type transport involved in Fe -S cluster assembly, ATPase component [Thermococcus cleftensis]|uniref:ABC-type transport involved in Fe-S cluster assembly, ATPase component n=1 Tax=Thermococcus cleftensis (strain DSM 27260 / KACC 17922 / CL1) TaxID=163003 RepID=I3ZRN1_THECF|nr:MULTISPECIES: Fe-S cluster assembly ATPase SufC [Thermococcus]AFL94365.1 ABC-type transport involved in Fe -S cluster assembly, ATPase component [Thermococcus cleftensis]NJE03288.1 Fe-S cluster assembly ATPase SufC [Thermococcus sp. MV11]
MLKVENLHVSVDNKKILDGVNLEVLPGEFHVVMGPNGSGKSTLALTIAGHPRYSVDEGKIIFKGEDITELGPDERAKRGIMLAFQHPHEVEGVKIIEFLQQVLAELKGLDPVEAYDLIVEKAKELWFREEDLHRYVNVGFSGGERKRLELLQALLIEPRLLILDEPDSGVDVDSLSVISRKIEELHRKGTAILLITHYGRILGHLDRESLKVHVMKDGRIVKTGSGELVDRIESEGFGGIFEEVRE